MNKKQLLKLVLLGTCSAALMAGFTACDLLGSKVPKGYTGAADYYDTEWELGEIMELREVVNFVQIDRETGTFYFDEYDLNTRQLLYPKVDYTLTFTNGEDTIDIGTKAFIELRNMQPGDWKFIYTVTEDCIYKGAFEIPVKIVAPALTVEMTLSEVTTTYYYGKTVTFDTILEGFNTAIGSYFPYTATFSKVVVGDAEKDLTGKESYTFNDLGLHVFTLLVESEDGQKYTEDININVVYDAIGEKYVYMMNSSDETVNIPLTTEYTQFKFNGEDFEYTRNDDGSLDIKKSLLYQNPGLCQISFLDANGDQKCYNVFSVTDKVDFEDGINILNVSPQSSKPPVVDGIVEAGDATQGNGRYAIGVKPTDWSVYFSVDAAYVKGVFADPLVDALTFKVYTPQNIATSVNNALAWYYENQYGNQNKKGMSAEDMGDYLLVRFSRSGYDAWAAVIDKEDTKDHDTFQILLRLGTDNGEGKIVWESAMPFYLDDFVAEKSFEIVGKDTMYAFNGTFDDYTVRVDGTVSDIWLNGSAVTTTAVDGGFVVAGNLLRSGVNQITFINSLGNRVEYRLIAYTTKIDFEDGFNEFVTPGQNDSTELVKPQKPTDSVPIATTSNTVMQDPNDWDLHFGLNVGWIEQVMAQTAATGIQFKIYTHMDGMGTVNGTNKNPISSFKLYSAKDESNVSVWSGYTCEDKGDYLLLTITREALESFISLNNAASEKTNAMVMHLRLGKLDTDATSATYGEYLWGALDFVYLDDFEAVLA